MKNIIKYSYLILITLMMLSFISCEKLIFEGDKASVDPFENFDYLWSELDKKYAYFDLKEIDWDQVRNEYRSRLFRGMSEDSLFNVMKAMIFELRDDHSNLISPFNVAVYNVALRGDDNYDSRIVEKYYLGDNIYYTSSFIHGFLEDEKIGYIRYNSFLSPASDDALTFMMNRYANTQGLVLDLRENGGGNFLNIGKMLSRFVSSETLIGYNRTKNGPGRNDFSEYEPSYIYPSDGRQYERPVVVLIDRGSYSATTFFALACRALPNVTLMGDTTGGGGGLPNGGQLPNGWTYRFSITQSFDVMKRNFAEDGVPPDIKVSLDWNNRERDEILEAAIEELVF